LEPAGEVLSIDDESLRIELKIGPSRSHLPSELSLIPTGPIGDEVLRAAIYRFADSVIARDGRFGAVESVLRRNLPFIKDRLTGEPVVAASAELLGSTVTAIEGLQNSHLLIQGPPGAGKTFISSRVIVELLMKGFKVGVSSLSHKAINKLLSDVEELAAERKFTFDGVKKSTKPEQALNGRCIKDVFDNKAVDLNCNLIAGTAWLFARPDFDRVLDYLIVDEG
jgi:Cdc6-like AAA superfamily ATPase